VDGVSRPLGDMFTVFATQNPVEHEGTYPLPEAQLDRFLIKAVMPYPSREAELELLSRYERGFDAERLDDATMPAALSATEVIGIRGLVDAVRVAEEVRAYIADITRTTRDERMLALGASPRATVSLFRAARAVAVLEGRDFVTPDDVKGIAPAVLRHRIALSPELEVEGRTADDVLVALLDRIRVPE
jgi:MoxR-like ATPase